MNNPGNRPPGVQVLRPLGEPSARDTSAQAPTHPAGDQPAEEPRAGPSTAQPSSPDAEVAPDASGAPETSNQWSYSEQRFFFDYLRVVEGTQGRDAVAAGVAAVLELKDVAEVGAYYDRMLRRLRRHFNKRSVAELVRGCTVEALHHTMRVYWERIMRPEYEERYNRSKESKGEGADKRESLRTDAAGTGTGGKKQKKRKQRASASAHAPGGDFPTPTPSICLEEPAAAAPRAEGGDERPAPTAPAAAASSGPLPAPPVKLTLRAGTAAAAAALERHGCSAAFTMAVQAHTPLPLLLQQLAALWGRAMPARAGVRLYPGRITNPALRGMVWSALTPNAAEISVADIVAILPPPEGGNSTELSFTWYEVSGQPAAQPAAAAAAAKPAARPTFAAAAASAAAVRAASAAVPGEDAMASLARAIVGAAAVSKMNKQRDAEAAAEKEKRAAAKAASGKKRRRSPAAEKEVTPPAGKRVASLGAAEKPTAEAAAAGATTASAAPPSAEPAVAPVPAPAAAPAVSQPMGAFMRVLVEKSMDAADALAVLERATAGDAAAAPAAAPAAVPSTEVAPMEREDPGVGSKRSHDAVAGKSAQERPDKRSRVPVGLHTLVQKEKQKRTPKKKRRQPPQQQQAAPAPAPAAAPAPEANPAPAPQPQQPAPQQPAMPMAYPYGMPLPAGMATYLNWNPMGQAQVLQAPAPTPASAAAAYQHMMAYHHQYHAAAAAAAVAHLTPPQFAMPGAPGAAAAGPATAPLYGMTSNHGDSLLRSLMGHTAPPAAPAVPAQPQQLVTPATGRPGSAETQLPGETPDADFRTPGKGARPGSAGDGGDSILKLNLGSWACLSPPPNFQLPPEFGAGSHGGASLLPSTSLLGFMDAHPKVQGVAATVMQQGVEALFQQATAAPGGAGTATNDADALAVDAAAAGSPLPLDSSLHSLSSLLEKSNSNWLAMFESAPGGKKEQAPVAPVGERPFAELFGT